MMSPSTRRSELACIKFEQRAWEKGGIVSRPSLECAYDRILDLDGTLSRVQIKHADGRSGGDGIIICKLARFGHGGCKLYQTGEIDAFAIYVPVVDCICWIPAVELLRSYSIGLRLTAPKTYNGRAARLISEYRW